MMRTVSLIRDDAHCVIDWCRKKKLGEGVEVHISLSDRWSDRSRDAAAAGGGENGASQHHGTE